LAWNDATCIVFSDLRQIPPHERNMVWLLFTSYQPIIVDWEGHARRILAEFRANYARYPDDPRLIALIQDLLIRSPEFRAWWPDHEVLGAPEGQKMLNNPHVGSLLFEHLAFQVLDAQDLKVTVYTPLKESDTPRKMDQLLEQWRQHEGQELQTSAAAHHLTPAQQSGQDAVGLWLADCCERVTGAWVANSNVMASYTNWCKTHGYEPKKAKGLSQSLAAHGLDVSILRWVYIDPGSRTKARGVNGLKILQCDNKLSTVSLEMGTNGNR
jgi:hypothetical protein